MIRVRNKINSAAPQGDAPVPFASAYNETRRELLTHTKGGKLHLTALNRAPCSFELIDVCTELLEPCPPVLTMLWHPSNIYIIIFAGSHQPDMVGISADLKPLGPCAAISPFAHAFVTAACIESATGMVICGSSDGVVRGVVPKEGRDESWHTVDIAHPFRVSVVAIHAVPWIEQGDLVTAYGEAPCHSDPHPHPKLPHLPHPHPHPPSPIWP